MKQIASRQNPLVARCRAVARNEMRALMLLDGAHLVGEAIAAGAKIVNAVVLSSQTSRPEIAALVDRLEQRGIPVASATSAVMAAVSPVRSTSAIVALAARPDRKSADLFKAAAGMVVVACGVQDPGNVGAIVRVAEAGGATGVVATAGSADPHGWKALRGSMGSALRLPIARCGSPADAVAAARAHACAVVATLPRGGRPFTDARLDGPLAILVGGEGAGLPDSVVDAADERVTIPMRSPVESLNAAVTAALLVYEARRQRSAMASAGQREARRARGGR